MLERKLWIADFGLGIERQQLPLRGVRARGRLICMEGILRFLISILGPIVYVGVGLALAQSSGLTFGRGQDNMVVKCINRKERKEEKIEQEKTENGGLTAKNAKNAERELKLSEPRHGWKMGEWRIETAKYAKGDWRKWMITAGGCRLARIGLKRISGPL